jgi:hypothetical protein
MEGAAEMQMRIEPDRRLASSSHVSRILAPTALRHSIAGKTKVPHPAGIGVAAGRFARTYGMVQ